MWTTGERRQSSLININTIIDRNLMEMLCGLNNNERRGKT
jgi:GTP:adenosylcobinamide-phosphate guanylyltransferase